MALRAHPLPATLVLSRKPAALWETRWRGRTVGPGGLAEPGGGAVILPLQGVKPSVAGETRKWGCGEKIPGGC